MVNKVHLRVPVTICFCSGLAGPPGPPGPPCASLPLGPLGGAPSASVGDAILGASPRKKPRKQQHIISTEESEMVEAQSTDEERSCAKPLALCHDKRKTPPKEYVGECGALYAGEQLNLLENSWLR